MGDLTRIRTATPLTGFMVRLEFTDGTVRDVDLAPYLRGPVFDPLRRDPAAFRALRVDSRMGTIIWENGADIDPDVLYLGLRPAWMDSEATTKP